MPASVLRAISGLSAVLPIVFCCTVTGWLLLNGLVSPGTVTVIGAA